MRHRDPSRNPVGWRAFGALVLALSASCCGRGAVTSDSTLLRAIMDAEDARGIGPAGVDPILQGTASSDPELRALAVRALGRLEDPDYVGNILPLLSDSHPLVRAEAANALGQAVYSAQGDSVASLLLDHMGTETDPQVKGVSARTLGRLRYGDPSALSEVEEALLAMTSFQGTDGTYPELLGAAMGLDWLVRNHRGRALSGAVVSRLRTLATYEGGEGGLAARDGARLRRVAFSALAGAGEAGGETAVRASRDPDPELRGMAAAALRRDPSPELRRLTESAFERDPDQLRREVVAALLTDPVAAVRTQAVLSHGALTSGEARCEGLLSMAADPDPGVAVAALDLLDDPCPDPRPQVRLLREVAAGSDAESPEGWHRGAHALLSLSELSPAEASEFLPAFASHRNPFARIYAARVAGATGDEEVLERLAEDDTPNVRTAAMEGLFHLRGHEADDILMSQLRQRDPQLLMTVASLLEGTPDPRAASASLLQVFHRISGEGRETDRDPRMAILERLAEVASVEELEGLTPYLSDYDPAVARQVAEILGRRTGTARETSPALPSRIPVPTPSDLEDLNRTSVILEMDGGGEVEIRLFPYLAPTNAARFVHLAESGVFDGLTFHRVVANFVIQGLSPYANEMAGHGPFTRDEIGLQSNWRGTVGVSTRGRDTGDGQIFINLVDNLRLDHNYTIFGEVVSGMEVVDRVVEGQVIQGVRIHRTP